MVKTNAVVTRDMEHLKPRSKKGRHHSCCRNGGMLEMMKRTMTTQMMRNSQRQSWSWKPGRSGSGRRLSVCPGSWARWPDRKFIIEEKQQVEQWYNDLERDYKSVQRDLDQLRGLWTKPLLGPQEGGSGLGKPRRITGLGKLKSLEEEIGNDEEEFEREIGNENKDGSNGNRILYLFFNDNGKCMRLTRSGKYLTSDRDEELRKLSNIKEM